MGGIGSVHHESFSYSQISLHPIPTKPSPLARFAKELIIGKFYIPEAEVICFNCKGGDPECHHTTKLGALLALPPHLALPLPSRVILIPDIK